ncbi:MAG TPA: SUMF1/EgtB/PvdO family nonheme iron enzyme [Stellaceae bacterium]|nr:SUMF1/EgtB/PvdO family nonheme iron enzyme [Stellaceae bacterium]
MPGEVRRFNEGKSENRPPEGLARRLAAIIAADIVGYSRLMGMDEEGTHARVTRYRRELIDPTIAEHHGRVVKNTGDGFIAVFDSPVEAVRCSIVIQQSVTGRSASLPAQQQILYRIGVNLGDVIVEPDDVYGDGVNVAARLERMAEPGSVYISGGVYEQIKNKLVCGYKALGDKRVKNITDPVTVYRVLADPSAVKAARQVRGLVAALAIVLVLAVGTGIGAFWLFNRSEMERQGGETARAPVAPPPSASAPPSAAPAAPGTAAAPTPVVAPAPAGAPSLLSEPEMVMLPGGSFAMGSNEDATEKPIHRVSIRPFAIGKYPVTVREWKVCVAANACAAAVLGAGAEDDRPITNVSWADADQYAKWLALTTRKPYRLPSEAEWEYAARGNTESKFWWGATLSLGKANCKGCGDPYDPAQPLKVGQFAPNPFGLYDMGGNVAQWVEDCYHRDFAGAPSDGSAWLAGDCFTHVLKGGSWRNDPSYVRPASRDQYDTAVRYPTHGFRVARSE